mmetsp:Transcript_7761/g.18269  ORF Transcript_7761/g.18269 Transcript_7761/m.18269 type:complete len:233 (-) Transcript_7761:93-791(-)
MHHVLARAVHGPAGLHCRCVDEGVSWRQLGRQNAQRLIEKPRVVVPLLLKIGEQLWCLVAKHLADGCLLQEGADMLCRPDDVMGHHFPLLLEVRIPCLCVWRDVEVDLVERMVELPLVCSQVAFEHGQRCPQITERFHGTLVGVDVQGEVWEGLSIARVVLHRTDSVLNCCEGAAPRIVEHPEVVRRDGAILQTPFCHRRFTLHQDYGIRIQGITPQPQQPHAPKTWNHGTT